jgi:hypothetical protein
MSQAGRVIRANRTASNSNTAASPNDCHLANVDVLEIRRLTVLPKTPSRV